MNGIRLIVIAVAAIGFLQVDLSRATAQSSQGLAEYYRNNGPGKNNGSAKKDQEGSATKGSATKGSSTKTSTTSRSRRSTRSTRSSRSSGNNAITTNPLLKYLDTDGNGELSLEEIDAASRMILELDENRDDAVTSDEVADMGGMMADKGMKDKEMMDKGMDKNMASKDDDRRSSRSRSRTSRSTASNSRNRKKPDENKFKNRMSFNGVGGVDASAGGSAAADDDFAGNDKNDDGVLTRSEMPRSLRTKFTRMDSNGDKEISEAEFYDYIDNQ